MNLYKGLGPGEDGDEGEAAGAVARETIPTRQPTKAALPSCTM
jgi:hypothetical protein